MEAVAPVIVTSQNRLDAAVSEAVKRGVREALAQLQSAEDERPGFGWVDNDTAMRLLNLSRPTLARYRADGTLPYAKLGSSVYYRLDALEEVLEARTVVRETS
jgi:hypothetical protein